MSEYRIDNIFNDLIPMLVRSGYTEKSTNEIRRNIQKVVDLHVRKGQKFYNANLVNEYIVDIRSTYDSKQMSRSRKNSLIKAALYINEIATTGNVALGVRTIPSKLCPYYDEILDNLHVSKEWGDSLKRNISYAAHSYFLYLQDCNIHSVTEITDDLIRHYIMVCANKMTPNSLNTIRRNLKHFHRWLYENNYTTCDFAGILSFTTPSVNHIKKPISLDEITQVLKAIDRNTDIGKRDYAMFLLAVVTGLRSVDIASLKFSDIDWINGEIRIIQEKTFNSLALPLTTDIGEAIKDYILHGRPESKLSTIFLTSRPPISALGRRGIYSAFNRVRMSIGLPKCSFHGLRRALGTNMVIAGIPITTVAQVLGHANISSTKQYISLDSIHLKECALDLDGIPLKRGGDAI